MKYTIEDLRGKYVESGTKEAEVFFDACTKLGAEHAPRIANGYKFVELIYHDNGKLILSGLGMEPSAVSTSTPFTINPDWSIYTNTLPLCELTDEQASMLFNAWRKGFEIENCLYDEKHEEFVWVNCFSVLSNIEGVYRIKSKSEREQFIDDALDTYDGRIGLSERAMTLAAGMMFDSGKFKLVNGGE
ncbi:MAG: hypothetical protein ACRCVV_21880 [Shewanella sp.]